MTTTAHAMQTLLTRLIVLRPIQLSFVHMGDGEAADQLGALKDNLIEVGRAFDEYALSVGLLLNDYAEINVDMSLFTNIAFDGLNGNATYDFDRAIEAATEGQRSDYAEHNTLNHAQQGI